MDLAIIDATFGATDGTLDPANRSRYTVPLANAPLMCHVFNELAEIGIERATIVAAPGVRQELERALARGGAAGIRVSYTEATEATEAEHRNTVLKEIEKAVGRGAVLLHPGDCLSRGQVTAMRDRYQVGDVDSVLSEQASVASRRSASDTRVTETILVLGPGTRPLLDDLLSPAGAGEDLIGLLLHSDCRLAVCELTEQWCYNESTDALLKANRMLLDSLPFSADDEFGEGNQVHGRVAIGHGAFMSNCVIHGPVAIGDRAVVEDSFVGPYTAIGTDAVISGTEIDNSMVLTGGEIRHPGARIEASIIGERARVTRAFDLPSGLHLRLGPDSRVAFS